MDFERETIQNLLSKHWRHLPALVEHVAHAEVVVAVAVVAIARKIIILDIKECESLSLLGIAGIMLALTVTFLVIRKLPARSREQPHGSSSSS